MSRRGFTLLEMMVATLIMGIAVVGLLSGISAATRNAARVGDADRAVLLARTKMDELLLDRNLARDATPEQAFQFLGAAINTYCPDKIGVLQAAAR